MAGSGALRGRSFDSGGVGLLTAIRRGMGVAWISLPWRAVGGRPCDRSSKGIASAGQKASIPRGWHAGVGRRVVYAHAER